ncbi:MAG: pur operon repressor [Thermoactinomycetaceae bacterium]|nr:pur operon repressor [Thermoactinomycetaceae bacterium]
MKKWRRSARLVDMTRLLIQEPHKLIPLGTFAERYGTAKSSISEDLDIIHEVLEAQGAGALETVSGAAGGVRFIPRMSRAQTEGVVRDLCGRLADPDRILPGGYLYLSDLLGDPALIREIGRIFATLFAEERIDAVVTVETKGIPLAYATATHLGTSVAIVRRDSRVTEGSVVTINTVSGSSRRIRTFSLARRSLKEGSRVLIVDDFMKAGGTVRGMVDLLAEFRAEVAGVCVMVESPARERLVDDYFSLAKVDEIDVKSRTIAVSFGNLFAKGVGFQ